MEFATLSDLAELSVAAYGGSNLSLPSGWHILSHTDLGTFAIPTSTATELSFFDSEGFYNYFSAVLLIDLEVFAVASVNGGRIPGQCGGVKAGQS